MEPNVTLIIMSSDDFNRLRETAHTVSLGRPALNDVPITSPPSALPQVYTFNEVRLRLSVSRPKLVKMVKQGEIGHLRCGREYRFTETHLMEYLNQAGPS